jgi:hypothetical protein
MAATQDINSHFSSLEGKIQKLIHLHEELKNVNMKLLAEKRQLAVELQEVKSKTQRMEEGYKNLKDIEKTSSHQSITNMKRKITDIILEIDKNVSLIENK